MTDILTKHIILIGNPVAGGGALKKIKRAVNILENKRVNVHLMLTTKKGDAELFAKQISQGTAFKGKSQECLVIAAGGDGTYNEVANGLIYSDIPMAILPLGTTSVLAKELNLPDNLQITIDAALRGNIKNIHLGKITLTDYSPPLSRYFILMAGIGFDGDVVYNVNEFIKKLIGKGAYILSGLISTAFYNPQKLNITYNENNKIESYGIIVGKASCYGGKYKITPDASLSEPVFHAFSFVGKRRRDIIRYVSGIIKNSHLRFSDIEYFSSSKFEIKSSGAHIQIDGDYIGKTPAEIEIAQNALRLVIP